MSRGLLVVTVPSQDGTIVGDLPEFETLIASFHGLLDQIEISCRRPVPRRLVRALDRHRELLIELGELRLGVAAVRVRE